jgi:hypothetical protein
MMGAFSSLAVSLLPYEFVQTSVHCETREQLGKAGCTSEA